MTIKGLSSRLSLYDEQEAHSIVRLLLEDCFGLSYTDICCGALDSLTEVNTQRLEDLMQRLETGEPIQYVTGKSLFYGREFHVEPGVLIPRPETEVLIDAIKVLCNQENWISRKPAILDIGTGSGCIAVTLAKEIEGAEVTAWDISEEALRIAKRNAECLGAKVRFKLQDALDPPEELKHYDIIVSNPPYICFKEADDMQCNVLDHEPHLALFVPDDDPLLFYRYITAFASKALKENGILAFEINPVYASDMQEMVSRFNVFEGVSDALPSPLNHKPSTINHKPSPLIHNDQFGKARCLLARRRSLAEGQNGLASSFFRKEN